MNPRELTLATAGLVVALASALVSLVPARTDEPDATRAAVAFQTVGEVKRRPADTLGWQRLIEGMGVFESDAVFVPPGGAGALRFDDGTELFLDERSLVVVERAPRGRRLRLRQGAVSGRVGRQSLSLETPVGEATLASASEARVEVGPAALEVTVLRGSASVGAQVLDAGQRVAAGVRGLEVLPSWPVQLVAPAPQVRLVYRDRPAPVELRWEGAPPRGARVQLAHDRLFSFVELELRAEGGALTLARPSAGVTWWRLVDERGAPVSEARRFILLEDVPAVALAPAEGEVVLASPGSQVTFGWTALAGAERYRLELSAAKTFEPVVLTKEVPRPSAKLVLALAEGSWYWRVRSVDGEVLGVTSKPCRFRLIHKAIPDAPELLLPELEVGE